MKVTESGCGQDWGCRRRGHAMLGTALGRTFKRNKDDIETVADSLWQSRLSSGVEPEIEGRGAMGRRP